MLPSFCLAGFTYGVEFVITLMQHAIEKGSIKKAVREWRAIATEVSRRLVNKYLARLRVDSHFISAEIIRIRTK